MEGLTPLQLGKLRKNLLTLDKIAAVLRNSQWPDSHLYQPDRGAGNKYSLAGGSLVEMEDITMYSQLMIKKLL